MDWVGVGGDVGGDKYETCATDDVECGAPISEVLGLSPRDCG